MAYIKSGGQVTNNRSKWRLSIIPEYFWYLLNQITFFFQSLLGNDVRSSSTVGGGRKPPQKRMGGFGPSGGGSGGPSGGGPSGGGPSGGGGNKRRGDMKNILACNAASG